MPAPCRSFQVARLFKDQPDLLDEFTHFLPDQTGQAQGIIPTRGGKKGAKGGNKLAQRVPPMPLSDSKKKLPAKRKKKEKEPAAPAVSLRDRDFFQKMQQQLNNPEQYQEILKCLNLYADELISRD
eukprot:SAG22_NODE_3651_length_1594_cov_2.189967_2_plen_125_part_01